MFALSVGLLAHLSACVFHYMALLTHLLTGSWAGTWVEAQGLVGTPLGLRCGTLNLIALRYSGALDTIFR